MNYIILVLGIVMLLSLISCLLATKYFPEYAHLRKSIILFNLLLFALGLVSHTMYIPSQIAWFLDLFINLSATLQIIMAIFALLVMAIDFSLRKLIKQETNNSRRNFLRACIWLPSLSLTAYGSLYEARHIEYTHLSLPTNSPKMNGIKAVQLSDVHLGKYFSLDKLSHTLEQILAQKPDILLMTGDIFDDNEINDEAINLINNVAPRFPLGVYYCWGNHEYFCSVPHLQAMLAKSNIKLLNNEAIKIIDDTVPLYILGVDYVSGGDEFKVKREECMEKALQNVPQNAYKILLAHHPIFLDNAFARQIDLTLAGHTHGGQFAILDNPLFPVFKYMMGKFTAGKSTGYVSRGAGSWFPCRIGCPPEITWISFKYNV